MRMFELIGPLSQIDQSVVDYIDADGMTKYILDTLAVPASTVRGVQEVEEIRGQREQAAQQEQEMAQMAQAAQAMGQAAPALKAIGDAQ